jgi:signal transduction histidine kinase/ActR/RegA family two-component response regulator
MRDMEPGQEQHWFDTYGQVALTGEPVRFQSTSNVSGRSYDVFAFRAGQPEDFQVAILFNDITERRRIESELREADRRKDEFLAMLAHELRNPLAPLRNVLEIMKLSHDYGGRLQHARDTMDRQLDHLTRLVDDLLDVSRISHGNIELKRERVELAAVIDQSAEAGRLLAERGMHELSITLPSEPVYLHADPVRLAQVIGNLLSNACKFMEPGGRIALTAELNTSGGAPEAIITVRDSGIGIPPEKLATIFEMFAQVDRTLERARGGLGIGLTLARRLVEMHGGSIEARSEGVGKGSEFVVRLPLRMDLWQPSAGHAEGSVPASAHDANSASSRAYRVLVVDDNVDSAGSMAALLQLSGNETRVAYDGLQALQTAEAWRPEIIFLDIGLPRLNGHDAARRIREQSWGKDVVLVALTGWGQEKDRRQSAEAGFDHHLVKPVRYADLTRILAQVRT